MLAFQAEYESGEIKLQEEEISDAQFLSLMNCQKFHLKAVLRTP